MVAIAVLLWGASTATGQGFQNEVEKFTSFYYYLNSLYVEEPDNKALVGEAISAVLESLDPHSAYVSPEQMRKEMEELFGLLADYGTTLEVELDLSLARGLNYYTGAIFEVKAKDYQIGSICGGGRYDDLTGIFGLPDTSGVGNSFGADRIYDVMLGLGLFPEEAQMTTKVMFVNFGGEERKASMGLLKALRAAGIPSDIYPDSAKRKKQMEYANKRAIPFVIIVGESERLEGMATVKNMTEGTQEKVAFEQLADYLK